MSNDPIPQHPPHRNILRKLPPSLSIDSAQTLTNRPLTPSEREALATLNKLKEFLANAPSRWSDNPNTIPFPNPSPRPALNRFSLPSNEFVTCVLWQGQYYISGTDIVRSLVFRFEAFGRPVRNMKKFEEGIFSDLRNLKPGSDATLEEPKSSFLDLLYKYQCIRTQKKQKVFYWFSVPHDRLFFDALERDIKRENMGAESASVVTSEPALSFKPNMNSGKTLWEEWMAKVKKLQDSGDLKEESDETVITNGSNAHQVWAGMFELFEGSPAYKQRRKRRSPIQSKTMDEERNGSLVRSNSLGHTPKASQQDLTVSRRDSQLSFYPSALPNRSTPSINTSSLDISPPSQLSAGYPSSLPFSTNENIDQMPHVVRSHSVTGAQRPLFQAQDASTTTATRPAYHPYPRPPARMQQNRHSSDPSTTSVDYGTDSQHQQLRQQQHHLPQPLQSHSYAQVHAPYVVPQQQQMHTISTNHSTYSSTNTQSGLGYATSGASNLRAFSCPTCGKLFQRPENWRNHVNEHSVIGLPKINKDIVECYTEVHAGQLLEDGPAIRSAPQFSSLPSSTVNTAPAESNRFAPGASTMPMAITSNPGWIGSPFSSSGSTRSIPPPSPASSPSGSSYAPSTQQSSGPYNQTSEYAHGGLASVAFEGSSRTGGYHPVHQRPETPGLESRPQTSSSYDSGLNFSVQSRRAAALDHQYGRHSSAPVSLSSGNPNMHGGPHATSALYYNAGTVGSYSTPSSNTTIHFRGSPSMEEFQSTNGHMSCRTQQQYMDASVASNADSSGYSQPVYSDGSVCGQTTWGTDYQNSPSPPGNYSTSEALQQQQQPVQQPVVGALFNNSTGGLQYFQNSGVSS